MNGSLEDNVVFYVACRNKNNLTPTRDAVAETIFEKKGLNHRDGLSGALTINDAIRHLKKNHGVVRIRAGDIRNIGRILLSRDLEIKITKSDSTHVLIRNMPCIDREHEEADANALASALAAIAEIESSDPVLIQSTTIA
ncbi:MAG TPA: hypothetical protein VKZ53_27110 [Candidatus Angelobacter sp.]|nr:hypothetical protein [Candidatus Angelobacter sp.]